MADRLHIRARHRCLLEGLLREHLPDVEAWAYGSRVNGRSHDGSDLDLVLRGPGLEEIPTERLMDFEEAVQESTIPYLVEARDWARLPERFRREVERGYVVVVAACESPCGDDVKWRESTWGEEITLEYGKARRGHRHKRATFRVFGSNGPIGWTDAALAPGPGVVLGRKGAYRGVEYSPDPFWVIDTAYYVASRRQHDMRWLYYAIKHHKIGEIDDGSPVPSTTRAAVYPCELAVPPLSEQRAIAHILGTLDDKIELNQRMNETLEAMARALFKSWFVDFDPVRAKIEGRDTGLPKDIADLFPDRLVESEMAEIPEGWEVSTIGQEVDAVGGSTPSTKEPSYWSEGQHCWATPKDLSKLRSPVLLDTSRKITDAGLRGISSGTLPVGTVLMSSRAPIGYLAVAEVPTAVNQGFIAMRCERRLPNLYVLFWCYHNLGHIKDIAGGSTFPEISKKAFRPLSVLVPSKPILQAFGRLSHPLHDQLAENMKQASTLSALRDTLLPKLVSGAIRVPAANRETAR